MIRPENRLLGRLPSKHDPRTLRLACYRTPAAPPPPETARWDAPVDTWGVQGNDRYGNCVICTAAHAIQAWRANESAAPAPISDSAVIALSRQMGAMNGYNILARLKYWRRETMFSNRLWAYALIDAADPAEIRNAIFALGVVDAGLDMPAAWRSAETWDAGSGYTYRPGTWGGHSVPLIGYDADHVYAITWGYVQQITWAGLAAYCDEAYGLINPEWIAADSRSPSGYDLAALRADLTRLAG